MDQRQFEQAILHMIHGEGLRRLRPTEVAYRMGVTLKEAERMLDRMVTEGALELDSDDDGNLFYHVPGGVAPPAATGQPPQAPGQQPTGWPQQPPPQGWGPQQQAAPGWQQPAGAPWGQPWTQAPPQQPMQAPTGHWGAAAPPGPPPGWQQGYPQPNAPYGQPSMAPGASPYGPPPPRPSPQGYAPPPGYPPQQGFAPQPPVYPGQAPGYPNQPAHLAQQSWNGNPNPPYYGQNALVPVQSGPEPKSPSTAAVLSAFFPGAGQVYNGQIGKGVALFFATMFTLVAFPLGLLPWAWSILDAYHGARRHNAYFGLLPP